MVFPRFTSTRRSLPEQPRTLVPQAQLIPDVPKARALPSSTMPRDLPTTVANMLAAAGDERTPENQRISSALKAAELFAKHKLAIVDPNAASPESPLENVLKHVDELFTRAESIGDRLSSLPRRAATGAGRRRYRR